MKSRSKRSRLFPFHQYSSNYSWFIGLYRVEETEEEAMAKGGRKSYSHKEVCIYRSSLSTSFIRNSMSYHFVLLDHCMPSHLAMLNLSIGENVSVH